VKIMSVTAFTGTEINGTNSILGSSLPAASVKDGGAMTVVSRDSFQDMLRQETGVQKQPQAGITTPKKAPTFTANDSTDNSDALSNSILIPGLDQINIPLESIAVPTVPGKTALVGAVLPLESIAVPTVPGKTALVGAVLPLESIAVPTVPGKTALVGAVPPPESIAVPTVPGKTALVGAVPPPESIAVPTVPGKTALVGAVPPPESTAVPTVPGKTALVGAVPPPESIAVPTVPGKTALVGAVLPPESTAVPTVPGKTPELLTVQAASMGPSAVRATVRSAQSGAKNSTFSNNYSTGQTIATVVTGVTATANKVASATNTSSKAVVNNNNVEPTSTQSSLVNSNILSPLFSVGLGNETSGTNLGASLGDSTDVLDEAGISTGAKTAGSVGSNTTVQQGMTLSQSAASKIGAEAVSKFAARLASRANGGASRFEMRMDPPQLGRIEVKMQVSADNRVHAILTVENPEVLQDLQRSADSLRRALVQEGFDLGANDLEFQLEQQGFGQSDADKWRDEVLDAPTTAAVMDDALAQSQTHIDTGNGYWLVSDRRIDIRA